MANKFRNELELKLGSEKILLRPTFENIASTESNIGSLQWLAYKFSRGMRLDDLKESVNLTDIAKVVFYNQAATNPDDETKKQFSLEEIWDLVQDEGLKSVTMQMLIYLGSIVGGNKLAAEPSSTEKKN